jgi:hypothetical protein
MLSDYKIVDGRPRDRWSDHVTIDAKTWILMECSFEDVTKVSLLLDTAKEIGVDFHEEVKDAIVSMTHDGLLRHSRDELLIVDDTAATHRLPTISSASGLAIRALAHVMSRAGPMSRGEMVAIAEEIGAHVGTSDDPSQAWLLSHSGGLTGRQRLWRPVKQPETLRRSDGSIRCRRNASMFHPGWRLNEVAREMDLVSITHLMAGVEVLHADDGRRQYTATIRRSIDSYVDDIAGHNRHNGFPTPGDE